MAVHDYDTRHLCAPGRRHVKICGDNQAGSALIDEVLDLKTIAIESAGDLRVQILWRERKNAERLA